MIEYYNKWLTQKGNDCCQVRLASHFLINDLPVTHSVNFKLKRINSLGIKMSNS